MAHTMTAHEAPDRFTPDLARDYLKAHDADVKRWHRMSDATRVRAIHGMAEQSWLFGGPETWDRDDQVSWLAEHRYPRVQEARKIYYAARGIK